MGVAMELQSAHKQLARAGLKVNGLSNEQKALLAKKHSLVQAEHAIQEKDKVMLAKEDQHLQVCRLKVRKLIGSLRVSALKLGALKVAYQAGKGKLLARFHVSMCDSESARLSPGSKLICAAKSSMLPRLWLAL